MKLIERMINLGYEAKLAEALYIIFIELDKKDILENMISTKEAVKEVID